MRLHDYQSVSQLFTVERLEKCGGAGLAQSMGLGKTVVSLHSALAARPWLGVGKTLVTCPLRVMEHWEGECVSWRLPFSTTIIHGTPPRRAKLLEIPGRDLYIINHEGLEWLEKTGFKSDLFIIDESSKFKNWSSNRTKAARRLVSKIRYRLLLTGTPVPNDISEIFAQQFLLDKGQALGNTITAFRQRYMMRGGYENREWLMRPGCTELVKEQIAPYWLRQDAVDHLDMPLLVINKIAVTLPQQAREVYYNLESQLFTELDHQPGGLLAESGAAKYTMLRQIASGSVYTEGSGSPIAQIHDAKTVALAGLIDRLCGKPLLVAYQYAHELQTIQKQLGYACPSISGQTSSKDTVNIKRDWIAGKIPVLLCQSQAISHGVDGLQRAGSDVCWYTLTDNPEVHEQLVARLYRQGQRAGSVTVHYLLAKGTVDIQVMRRIETKDKNQKSVLEMLKRYRQEKHGTGTPATTTPATPATPATREAAEGGDISRGDDRKSESSEGGKYWWA